ncbi:MAG: T9SS type A sorting domain-containing protein [Bacteroidales bacterium]|nr:T9SS type A sorting domain-containing protein [Bacteroidales bacterium]
MIKRSLLLVLISFINLNIYAQESLRISLNSAKNKIDIIEDIQELRNGIKITESIPYIDLKEVDTKKGKFIQLISKGTSTSYDQGKPNLPIITRLIEVPANKKVHCKILDYEEDLINLNDYNVQTPIIPAQPSYSKSDKISEQPFHMDENIYSSDKYFTNKIVKTKDRGYLRNKHLVYIEISPFQYNPVTNNLKILNNIELEIKFINNDNSVNISTNLNSPYFDNILTNTLNPTKSKSLISSPVKYVIVSDPIFQESLQSFIEWKKLKGFNVIESYTDNPDVGTSKETIKAYLKDLYTNPTDGVSPTFILFVGDVEQIPSFPGTTQNHVTDLYYCEYTDDNLPDVFYGRFSATSVEELQPQINKTLEVEKYTIPDPSYLNNAVVVAGHDDHGNDLVVGNGLVNYATQNYLNNSNGINTYSYLSPESQNQASEIRENISNGVSIANYTAHCFSGGWANPAFTTDHVSSMTNKDMYPLMIGNCCLSNKFDDDECFGEALLRAKDKGAVGYIGASNSSLWDEDFYWGVGLAEKSSNPTYANSDLGFYDRFFHSNSEGENDWYITQGQMITAGNLAVESSASANKLYYWEIYHLMGDPSLTPYVKIPETISASYNSEITLGANGFQVTTEKNTYVAISYQGQLLDAKLTNNEGIVNLSFYSLEKAGDLDLVITKQNRQPLIDRITINPNIPYVVLNTFTINDNSGNNNGLADYNETVNLNINLKNISNNNSAENVKVKLTSLDTNITIIDDTEPYGTINKADELEIEDAFSLKIKSNIEDQHTALFELNITGEDVDGNEYSWNSKLNLTLNAPKLKIKEVYVPIADNKEYILKPNQSNEIYCIVSNIGNSAISNISALASDLMSENPYLELTNTEIVNIDLDENDTDTLKFNATLTADAPLGKSLYLNFKIDPEGFYSQELNGKFIVGEIPEIFISAQGIVQTDFAYFYDAGGNDHNYNNNENYSITFTPKNDNKLMVNFLSLETESGSNECYDVLSIYDGENTSSPLIDQFCSYNKLTTIISSNEKGALTFKFNSDNSVNESGWKAEISSYSAFNYSLKVFGENGPIQGAKVLLNKSELITNSDGLVTFNEVIEGIDIHLQITAEGYELFETSVNILNNKEEEIRINKTLYNLTFIVKDKSNNAPVKDAEISFLDQTVKTDGNGLFIFNNLVPDLNKNFSVSKEGYTTIENAININSTKTINVCLSPIVYDVSFEIIDENNNPIEGVEVTFGSNSLLSDETGKANFTNNKPANNVAYTLIKSGYNEISGTVSILDEDVVVNKTMSLTTGVSMLKEKHFTIYPNPSNGKFKLLIKNIENTEYRLSIFNVLGVQVLNKKLNGTNDISSSINISNENSGVYFIKLTSDKGDSICKKIYVE